MGSLSPFRALESAPTASAVVPPNMDARSAPRVTSSLVFPPSSDMAVPPFFSWVPITVDSWLYWSRVKPTDWAAFLAHWCIWPALSLKTVSMAPMDCWRSPASEMADFR